MFTTFETETVVPSDDDARVALASSKVLTALLDGQGTRHAHIHLSAAGEQAAEINLPFSVVRLLAGALKELAEGNAVTLLRVHAELTTQQAAALMRVSRPSLIKMLDENKVPSRKVGAHRRIRYGDVLLYLKNERARRAQVMKELTAETEKLGLY